MDYALYLFFREKSASSSKIERRHHVLESGLQKAVKTTEIYTHVMRRDIHRVQNPLDRLYKKTGEQTP